MSPVGGGIESIQRGIIGMQSDIKTPPRGFPAERQDAAENLQVLPSAFPRNSFPATSPLPDPCSAEYAASLPRTSTESAGGSAQVHGSPLSIPDGPLARLSGDRWNKRITPPARRPPLRPVGNPSSFNSPPPAFLAFLLILNYPSTQHRENCPTRCRHLRRGELSCQ